MILGEVGLYVPIVFCLWLLSVEACKAFLSSVPLKVADGRIVAVQEGGCPRRCKLDRAVPAVSVLGHVERTEDLPFPATVAVPLFGTLGILAFDPMNAVWMTIACSLPVIVWAMRGFVTQRVREERALFSQLAETMLAVQARSELNRETGRFASHDLEGAPFLCEAVLLSALMLDNDEIGFRKMDFLRKKVAESSPRSIAGPAPALRGGERRWVWSYCADEPRALESWVLSRERDQTEERRAADLQKAASRVLDLFDVLHSRNLLDMVFIVMDSTSCDDMLEELSVYPDSKTWRA